VPKVLFIRGLLLAELHAAGRLDWSTAVTGSSRVRALKGGPKRVRPGRPRQDGLQAPCDRRWPGHPPLALSLTGATATTSRNSCRCCGASRQFGGGAAGPAGARRRCRLRIRWEIRDDIHEAFMTLAAVIICRRHLTR
jgi:hypothetical protein